MIRRFTSAQFVPANAGAKAKNPVGSTLFSTPMVALLRHPGHQILRTCCRESAHKRLKGDADVAFIRLPSSDPEHIQLDALFYEDMLVTLPIGHPLEKSTVVPLAALSGQPFILYPGGSLPRFTTTSLRAAGKPGSRLSW